MSAPNFVFFNLCVRVFAGEASRGCHASRPVRPRQLDAILWIVVRRRFLVKRIRPVRPPTRRRFLLLCVSFLLRLGLLRRFRRRRPSSSSSSSFLHLLLLLRFFPVRFDRFSFVHLSHVFPHVVERHELCFRPSFIRVFLQTLSVVRPFDRSKLFVQTAAFVFRA